MIASAETYPRYLQKGSAPFDPLELFRKTERIVCQGDRRKYTKFYCTGVYGGIATGYTCGCCLRCVFCWVDWSRDFPERYGAFYSPEKAFGELSRVARKAGVKKLRISGAEPTLGKAHLLGLLKIVESSAFGLFILETNGILLGHVASMTGDSRIVSRDERQKLLDRLESIYPGLVRHLEEEVVDPYCTTIERLKHAGIKLEWK